MFLFLYCFSFKAKEKPQAELEERPRGNIPFSLYLSYLKAGGSYVTLFLFLLLGFSAQVISEKDFSIYFDVFQLQHFDQFGLFVVISSQGAFTLSDWWLSQWYDNSRSLHFGWLYLGVMILDSMPESAFQGMPRALEISPQTNFRVGKIGHWVGQHY